mmetsp:Transcript_17065/g.36008  ORF Transcript_17065/g.36008 Transcript_17065/m.36008 type:complete len:329 (+) Transcript_17065:2204-3190(+)
MHTAKTTESALSSSSSSRVNSPPPRLLTHWHTPTTRPAEMIGMHSTWRVRYPVLWSISELNRSSMCASGRQSLSPVSATYPASPLLTGQVKGLPPSASDMRPSSCRRSALTRKTVHMSAPTAFFAALRICWIMPSCTPSCGLTVSAVCATSSGVATASGAAVSSPPLSSIGWRGRNGSWLNSSSSGAASHAAGGSSAASSCEKTAPSAATASTIPITSPRAHTGCTSRHRPRICTRSGTSSSAAWTISSSWATSAQWGGAPLEEHTGEGLSCLWRSRQSVTCSAPTSAATWAQKARPVSFSAVPESIFLCSAKRACTRRVCSSRESEV